MPIKIDPISAVDELSKTSPYVQIAAGAAGGFITGFVLLKVGKMVAVSIGGAILIFEIAVESGVIKIDWNKVLANSPNPGQPAITRVRNIGSEPLDQVQLKEKVRKLIATSGRFCISFVGGFFLGFGLA